MLLLIDAGNTAIKWATLESASVPTRLGGWQQSGSCSQDQVMQLATVWRAAMVTSAALTRVLVSNVAGPALGAALSAQLHAAFGPALRLEWFASQPSCAGVRNGYRDPAQLGCDRFAAAIAARALFPTQALIIATCGTATTVDALAADGVFLGGMILPGLGLMARALASNTAQLPLSAAQAAIPAQVLQRFADNTADAIASGCLAAQVGAIERALALHAQQQVGAADGLDGPVRCLLAGGAAALIAPHLTAPCERVDNLVLIGLQVAAMDDGTTC